MASISPSVAIPPTTTTHRAKPFPPDRQGSIESNPVPTPSAITTIEPLTGWSRINLGELWHCRELLAFLIWRDVKVRYEQTVLGVGWAILVPLFSMIVFTVIFGNFVGLKNSLPPQLVDAYPVYVYAGLLPWLFFSNCISQGALSLLNQRHMLTKVYFPRLYVPTATAGASLVDMGISLLLFLGLAAIYRIAPSPLMVMLPLLVLLTGIASLGVSFFLAALVVRYRDFRFVLPFLLQMWQFLSPVVYPTSIIPERYQWLMSLNPMTGIINGFRTALLGTACDWISLSISSASAIGMFTIGILYFKNTERAFADIA